MFLKIPLKKLLAIRPQGLATPSGSSGWDPSHDLKLSPTCLLRVTGAQSPEMSLYERTYP